jgi:uncharacterized protein (TIGR02246 family)
MKTKILIALIFIAMTGCNMQKVDMKTEGEKVMQASREWSQTASTGNVEKILSYWTDDAVVISPGQPALKGKNEIRQMVEGSFKTPGFHISWQPQSVEVSQSGDMAYLIEKSEITFNDSLGKAITTRYNGVTVWKKQTDGSWKNVVDIAANE